MKVSALTLAAVYGSAQGLNVATNPSEKVVQLLNKLTVEVKEEGKTEEQQFADYAKFCKRTIDEKKYVIGKQTKKLGSLTADIEVLGTAIKELTGDLETNAAAIEKSEADIKKLDEDRDAAVATYNGQAKEMSQAISALSRAIKVLAAGDSKLGGKVDRTAFLQADAAQVLQSASSIRDLKITAEQIETLTALQAKPGDAAAYTSKTTGVVSMLKGLLSTFKANKATLDMDEETAKGTYQKTRLALNQQLDIQNKEKSEKTMSKTQKTENKAKADADKTATDQAKTADSAFLAALEEDCEAKAKLNDERSAKRKEELKALADAAEKLREGGVMKEPSFLQVVSEKVDTEKKKVQKHRTRHWETVRDLSPKEAQEAAISALKEQEAASFLQLEARTNIMNRLSSESARLHSHAMAGVALRVRGVDNFASVRTIVKGLMAKLTKEGEEEATTKATCDEMVTKHSKERDDATAMIETKTTEIDSLSSAVNKLSSEVAELNDEIAKTTKDLEEATALRSKEKANNEKALEEAKAALQGTSMALQILSKFYEGEGFFLQKKAQQPKDAYSGEFVDSSGKGLSDVAPKVELGSQESSGVLGMLDVLKSDFESEIASTEKAEKEAAEEFTKLKDDSEAELKSNNEAVTTKTGTIKTKTEDNMKAKADLADEQDKLNLSKDALDKLRGMCTNDENAYQKRKAKREEEIKSLSATIEEVNAMIKEEEDA
eukprot:TRINITY_DN3882_c0_g1_i2.p1 TRINITY_DN3882_c0_g1~~TRINITY_DN3882_c0_g1_i2.p1  ORF type:complete len:720 (+),score=237.60 TRINITY_DN3882_c0_g1_i2:80-2239(+)